MELQNIDVNGWERAKLSSFHSRRSAASLTISSFSERVKWIDEKRESSFSRTGEGRDENMLRNASIRRV